MSDPKYRAFKEKPDGTSMHAGGGNNEPKTKNPAKKKAKQNPENKTEHNTIIEPEPILKFPSVGKPRTVKTVEDLISLIDDYFKNGVRKKTVIIGKGDEQETVDIPMPTITGLCIHCGYESRQSFYDNEKIPEYSYIIKKARLFIESLYEESLIQGNTTGAIFALKNMGWIDKTEIASTNHNINTERIPITFKDPHGGD